MYIHVWLLIDVHEIVCEIESLLMNETLLYMRMYVYTIASLNGHSL